MARVVADSQYLQKECRRKMWSLMQQYDFDKKVCVQKWKKWAAKNKLVYSNNYPWRAYLAIMKKMASSLDFQECASQFLHGVMQVNAKMVKEAVKTGDVQDYLMFMERAQKVLGLSDDKTSNIIFNQNTTNSGVVQQITGDEVIARLRDNFARFGPVLQRLGTAGGDDSAGPTIDVPSEQQAGYRLGK